MKWKEKIKCVFLWTGLLLIAVQICSCGSGLYVILDLMVGSF